MEQMTLDEVRAALSDGAVITQLLKDLLNPKTKTHGTLCALRTHAQALSDRAGAVLGRSRSPEPTKRPILRPEPAIALQPVTSASAIQVSALDYTEADIPKTERVRRVLRAHGESTTADVIGHLRRAGQDQSEVIENLSYLVRQKEVHANATAGTFRLLGGGAN